MYKIGVIGDKESVLGFKACGFEVFMTESPDEASRILKHTSDNEFAVIYITEDLAKNMTSVLDEYKSVSIPTIILIPSKNGSLGIGIKNVKSSVERAVGADILFKDGE